MFPLVSRKFFAMRNITLYSVGQVLYGLKPESQKLPFFYLALKIVQKRNTDNELYLVSVHF